MATDKPISAFPLVAAVDLDPGDLLVMVDVTNTSSSSSGTTSTMTLKDALNNPQNGIITGVIVPIRGTAAAGRIVNTAQNGMVFQSSGGTLTDFSWLDSSGAQIAAGRASDSALIATKFMGVSAAPTVVVGSGAGTGATVTVDGSDTNGVVTLTTGTGAALGTIFTLTFSNPFSGSNMAICQYKSGDTKFPVLEAFATSTTLAVTTYGALDDAFPYQFNYLVMGYGN